MSTKPTAQPPTPTPPPGYVTYAYFAFNPKTHHVIYSNDGQAWVDEAGNPVPATGANEKK